MARLVPLIYLRGHYLRGDGCDPEAGYGEWYGASLTNGNGFGSGSTLLKLNGGQYQADRHDWTYTLPGWRSTRPDFS